MSVATYQHTDGTWWTGVHTHEEDASYRDKTKPHSTVNIYVTPEFAEKIASGEIDAEASLDAQVALMQALDPEWAGNTSSGHFARVQLCVKPAGGIIAMDTAHETYQMPFDNPELNYEDKHFPPRPKVLFSKDMTYKELYWMGNKDKTGTCKPNHYFCANQHLIDPKASIRKTNILAEDHGMLSWGCFCLGPEKAEAVKSPDSMEMYEASLLAEKYKLLIDAGFEVMHDDVCTRPDVRDISYPSISEYAAHIAGVSLPLYYEEYRYSDSRQTDKKRKTPDLFWRKFHQSQETADLDIETLNQVPTAELTLHGLMQYHSRVNAPSLEAFLADRRSVATPQETAYLDVLEARIPIDYTQAKGGQLCFYITQSFADEIAADPTRSLEEVIEAQTVLLAKLNPYIADTVMLGLPLDVELYITPSKGRPDIEDCVMWWRDDYEEVQKHMPPDAKVIAQKRVSPDRIRSIIEDDDHSQAWLYAHRDVIDKDASGFHQLYNEQNGDVYASWPRLVYDSREQNAQASTSMALVRRFTTLINIGIDPYEETLLARPWNIHSQPLFTAIEKDATRAGISLKRIHAEEMLDQSGKTALSRPEYSVDLEEALTHIPQAQWARPLTQWTPATLCQLDCAELLTDVILQKLDAADPQALLHLQQILKDAPACISEDYPHVVDKVDQEVVLRCAPQEPSWLVDAHGSEHTKEGGERGLG